MTSQQQKRKAIFMASKRLMKNWRSHMSGSGTNEQLELAWDVEEETPSPAKEERRDFFPEREKAIEELKRRFDLPLDSQVRVTIKGIPGEFTGKLTLATLLFPQKAKDAIPMRIGRVTFDLRDIESCSRL